MTTKQFSQLCLSSQDLLRYLMNTIGIMTIRDCDRIVGDRFHFVCAIVHHHSNNIGGFKTYLIGLNQMFSPVIIARFMGIAHLYNQAIRIR